LSENDRFSNLQEIEKYVENLNHYYNNSQILLNKGEYPKAGELLWGSIVEAAKALSLKYTGQPISDHKRIKKYIDKLCLGYSNIEDCIKMRQAADRLHINFYETFLENDEFWETYENGRLLLSFLLGLLLVQE
jgi:uncharacterized protein (UPF0332 family)